MEFHTVEVVAVAFAVASEAWERRNQDAESNLLEFAAVAFEVASEAWKRKAQDLENNLFENVSQFLSSLENHSPETIKAIKEALKKPLNDCPEALRRILQHTEDSARFNELVELYMRELQETAKQNTSPNVPILCLLMCHDNLSNWFEDTNLSNDCKNLKYQLEQIISDIKYIKDGGQIRYAVDFSEIRSYVLPNENSQDFLVFKDEDKNSENIGLLYQSYFLQEMFYNLPEPLILLDCYAIELRNFLRSIHEGELEQEVKYLITIYKEKEKILNDKDIEYILELGYKYKHKPNILRPKEYDKIVDYMEKNAADFLRFITYQDENFQLIQRIRECL